MEPSAQLKCACGNCGEVIEYRADAAGQVVECPKCKEKSLLPQPVPTNPAQPENLPPEPPKLCPVCGATMPPYGSACAACETKRRLTLGLFVGVLSAVVVLGVGWLFLKRYYTNATARAAPPPRSTPAAPEKAILPQPRVRGPKSMKDFKIGSFSLESQRGNNLVLAVGDIQNISANLYRHVMADVDLLDVRGTKIGTVSAEVRDFHSDMTWRFIANVNDPRAKSARFAGLKEIP